MTTGERKRLVANGAYPRYLASGHLLYWHKGVLFAAPLDIKRLLLTGPARPVLEDVAIHRPTGTAGYAVSASGLFVYTAVNAADLQRPILMLDDSGTSTPLPIPKGRYDDLRIAPDGIRVAMTVAEGSDEHIGIYDTRTRQLSQFPFAGGNSSYPVWSPDGKWLLFAAESNPSGPGIYAMRADGASEARRLVEGTEVIPWSVSPRSDELLYTVVTGPKEGTYRMALKWGDGGPEPGRAERIGSGTLARFSADGKWLAFDNLVQGTPNVFVVPAAGPGRWMIGPGYDVSWSPAGNRLFFRYLPGFRLASVRYSSTGNSFAADPVRFWSDQSIDTFDVMPDGRRVLAIPAGPGQKTSTRATFLVNFADEVRRRVPAGK